MSLIRKRSTVVVVHAGKILGFRAQDPTSGRKYFFLPGGKIEDGESARESAVRETLEETGYAIALDPAREVYAQYDFDWDGAVNECHTWFYRGYLDPATQRPPPVLDASYHQGVEWVPVARVREVFAYHAAILDAVEKLI